MNQKPDKLIPALYGGVIMAIISAIPFLNFINCLCCAAVMLGGFFAVFFYKNNFTPDTPPYTSGECMGVGALAGVFGAIIGTILYFAVLAVFGNITTNYMMDILQNSGLNIPSEAFDAMEESMAAGMSLGTVFIQLLLSLVVDTLFGLLGGLIAYSAWILAAPVTLDVRFKNYRPSEVLAYLPIVERTDAHSIRFKGKDMVETIKFLQFLVHYEPGLTP